MQMEIEKPWLILINDQKRTVQEFFDFYHINQKKRRGMLARKDFLVNKEKTEETAVIEPGDHLALRVLDQAEYGCAIADRACRVIYEDEFVLVAAKPAGIIIHDDGQANETLDSEVAAWLAGRQESRKVRHLHRLDQQTSGCVLYSKCEFFQPYLDWLLSEKKIRRQYAAVVSGIIPWDRKTIDLPIGKDRHHAKKRRVSKTGKSAITHVAVTARNRAKKTTLIRCTLDTGRTHQIRVHLAALGYPLLADELYGKPSPWISRCALHAESLSWIDPVSQEKRTVYDPIPEEITACVL